MGYHPVMNYLFPALLSLVGVVCVVALVRRRVRISSPHPRVAVAWRLVLGVGLPVAAGIYRVDLFGGLWFLTDLFILPLDLAAVWLISRVIAHVWTAPGLGRCLAVGIAASLVVEVRASSDEIGVHAYFLRHQSAYQRVLEHVRDSSVPDRGMFAGVDYQVELGPTRVAFPWPGGIIDNWFGVVHDPSGGVTRAPHDASIRELFGGDLIGVRHLWGPWYLCSFT